jgi:hypothetical protein
MRYGQTTILCFFAQRPETELRCKRESGTDFLLGIWRRAHMCSDATRCDGLYGRSEPERRKLPTTLWKETLISRLLFLPLCFRIL